MQADKRYRGKSIDLTREEKLFSLYLKERSDIEEITLMFRQLQKQYDLSNEKIISLIKEKDKLITVPLSIFNNNLAPLEALTVFLKDSLHYKFSQIASMLNRNDRTIWFTYTNAKKKNIM